MVSKRFKPFLLQFYDEAREPSRLTPALAMAASHLGAEVFCIEQYSLMTGGEWLPTGKIDLSRPVEGLLGPYYQYLEQHPHPRSDWAARVIGERKMTGDLDMLSRKEIEHHPFHQEIMALEGMPYALFGVMSFGRSYTEAVAIHFDSARPLQARQVRADAQRIMGCASQVHKCRQILQDCAPRGTTSHFPSVVLDGNHRLLELEAYLPEGLALRPDPQRRCLSGDPKLLKRLDSAVDRVFDRLADGVYEEAVQTFADGVHQVLVLPAIAPPGKDMEFAVRVICTTDHRRIWLDHVLGMRGLSNAERSFCLHTLDAGATVNGFAERRGIQPGTARLQAKAAMRKLQVHSQMDLLRQLQTLISG